MRCPKCGFISFDSRLACGKCQADLSLVSVELRGTAMEAAAFFFLGSLLSEGEERLGAVADGISPEAEGAEAVVASEAPEKAIAGAAELEAAPPAGEEPPALEFDLDEMPAMEAEPDEIAFELPAVAESTAVASVAAHEGEAQAAREEGLPLPAALEAAEQPALAGEPDLEMGLDLGGEGLEAASMPPSGVQVLSEEAPPPGPPAVDLSEIDISDLVAEGSEGAAPAKEEGTLVLDEMVDLSLFAELVDVGRPDVGEGDGLSPIDLTVGGDALFDLTIDQARKDKADNKASPASGIPELSMEGPE